VGELLPGAPFQAAIPQSREPSAERKCAEIPSAVFGDAALSDITAEAIEDHLAEASSIATQSSYQAGIGIEGHLRILSRMLKVAVKRNAYRTIPVGRSSSRFGRQVDPQAALHDGE
jgi:hypothetical protein